MYRIAHAKIELSKYSFKTLISVKPANDETRTYKTYFFVTANKNLYGMVLVVAVPVRLLLVFIYTAESALYIYMIYGVIRLIKD